MKRIREEEIMLKALQSAGYDTTDSIKNAVASGLCAIRREKYIECTSKKQAWKHQKAKYHKIKLSKDAKTLKAIREILATPDTPQDSA